MAVYAELMRSSSPGAREQDPDQDKGILIRITSLAPLELRCAECGWTPSASRHTLPGEALHWVVEHWLVNHWGPGADL